MSAQQLTDTSVRKLKAPATGQTEVWDGRIPGFGVRVTPKGTKSFILLYRSGGRQRRLTIGRYPALTLSDARRKAQGALRDAALGGDPAGDKRSRSLLPDHYRFEVFVSEFIEKHAKRKNKSWEETQRVLTREFVHKWGRGMFGRSPRMMSCRLLMALWNVDPRVPPTMPFAQCVNSSIGGWNAGY
jgi:hypothetical protein